MCAARLADKLGRRRRQTRIASSLASLVSRVPAAPREVARSLQGDGGPLAAAALLEGRSRGRRPSGRPPARPFSSAAIAKLTSVAWVLIVRAGGQGAIRQASSRRKKNGNGRGTGRADPLPWLSRKPGTERPCHPPI
jgi:hypothetical protein